MKIPATLLVTALPLLCSCAQIVTLTPSAKDLHAGESSTIAVALTTNGTAPAVPQSVQLDSDSAAAVFPSGQSTTVQTAAGAASATVTAKPVDRDTPVTITGSWVINWQVDPTGATTVTVHPPVASSTPNGENYVTVSPAVVPQWKYTFAILPVNSAGGATVELTSCTITFETKVSLRVVSAEGAAGPITVTATENANNTWFLSGGVNITKLTVEATANDADTGGIATVTCPASDGHTYTISVTGPKP